MKVIGNDCFLYFTDISCVYKEMFVMQTQVKVALSFGEYVTGSYLRG